MDLNKGKNLLISYIDDNKLCGASFAYISLKDNSIISDYYGYKQTIDNKIPLQDKTLYDMASCTKVIVTTTLILKLIEDGYFNLKTKVKDILTDFPYDNITILHLLTHTSGLIGDDKKYRNCKNKEDMYQFINSLPLAYPTDTDLQYSDFGFILLGRIIEKYKGSIDTYAKEIIFEPLNMVDTMFNPVDTQRCAATELHPQRGLIIGQAHDGKAHIMGGVSGNAGLFSTVDDVAKFVMMLLKQDNTVLCKSSIDLLKTYRTVGKNSLRTLGWIANDNDVSDGDYYSNVCLYHTGFTGTSIYVDFVRECGIVLLTNAIHPNRGNPYIVEIRNNFHNVILSQYN